MASPSPTHAHLSPTPVQVVPSGFIDGSSFKDPQPAAGYATIDPTLPKLLEVVSLLPHTTSQQAELTALTRALILAKHKD
jgi:ribonuclease HI